MNQPAPNPLETLIRDRITRQGPLPFRDFMALALYDPAHGYYTTNGNRIGRAGDFYTSSSIAGQLGKLLARQIQAIWQALGQPADFTVVECGAGMGDLAVDILTALRTASPDLFHQVRYVIDEVSPAMQAIQATRLAPFRERVCWQTLDALSQNPITGLIFSNEMVDALPVHLLICRRGQYLEGLVSIRQERLSLIWAPPTQPEAFLDYLAVGEIQSAEGDQYEIALDALDWLARAASALARGYLITIDYGDTGPHLAGRPAGTIRSFARHCITEDVLAKPGQQDITADVNFSALIQHGLRQGLRPVHLTRQADYLVQLGLLDLLAAVTQPEHDRHALQTRLALKHFLVPGGFGDRFKVLVQAKGNGLPNRLPVPQSALTGPRLQAG